MLVRLATMLEGEASLSMLERFMQLASADCHREHSLTASPSAADYILFVDLHVDDHVRSSPKQLRDHPLVRKYRQKIRVYDQRDQPFLTFPGLVPSANPRLAAKGLQVGAPYARTILGPRPAMKWSGVSPDLLFSFQGARNHPLRTRVLKLQHSRAILEDTTPVSFFQPETPEVRQLRIRARERYTEALARSMFVLCPRGYGASSFRIFEVLSVGRVPVIISDAWTPPSVIDWSSCSLRVPEADAERIPDVLEAAEGRARDLMAGARRAHEMYLSEENLWHTQISLLASLRPRRPIDLRPWWGDRSILRAEYNRIRRPRSLDSPAGGRAQ